MAYGVKRKRPSSASHWVAFKWDSVLLLRPTFDQPMRARGQTNSRPASLGVRNGDGVVIRVHVNCLADELPRFPTLAPIIEHCFFKLYPTGGSRAAIRISGMHIPLSNINPHTLRPLLTIAAPVVDSERGGSLPHIFGSDLNNRSWGRISGEWTP